MTVTNQIKCGKEFQEIMNKYIVKNQPLNGVLKTVILVGTRKMLIGTLALILVNIQMKNFVHHNTSKLKDLHVKTIVKKMDYTVQEHKII